MIIKQGSGQAGGESQIQKALTVPVSCNKGFTFDGNKTIELTRSCFL